MRKTLVLALLLSLAVLAGCSAVGEMPVEFDDYARGIAPAEDEALVYVVRPSSSGKAARFTMYCDGDSIGATGGGRYIFTLQEPGPHLFESQAENRSELPIVLEGGRTYFLEQKIRMGLLSARAKLERLDDVEGLEKLRKCTLSNEVVAHIPGSEAYMKEYLAKKQRRVEQQQQPANY